jgi:hypothetical protein
MRFYEFEAKQLLAKAGIAPHPRPLSPRERGDRQVGVRE